MLTKKERLKNLFNNNTQKPDSSKNITTDWGQPIASWPEIQQFLDRENREFDHLVSSIYFHTADSNGGAYIEINGNQYMNLASYDYLGLASHPEVISFVQKCVAKMGTSGSSSRLLTGGRPIHKQLESELATFLGVENILSLVSGHATNMTVLGHLFNEEDLIIHDNYIHNSITEGIKLSGAHRLSFPHNNISALEILLKAHHKNWRRTLIVVEGVYSMDGDIPDLKKLIDLKTTYGCYLMVDEAHSIGVLGNSGMGLAEYYDIDPMGVDIWMGTLSKSLASCGGYLGGSHELIKYLSYSLPGYLFSTAITPANTAAALASLRILRKSPELVQELQNKSRILLELCKSEGLNTGFSNDSPVIPIIFGDSKITMHVASELFKQGYVVTPVLYPAVSEKESRLRLFVCRQHKEDDLKKIPSAISTAVEKINNRLN